MKFYKIDNQGIFQVPRVSTLPDYNDDVHTGSLYYQESNNTFYLGVSGVNGGWGKVIMDISTVTDRIDIIENNIDTVEASILNVMAAIESEEEIDITLTVTPALKKSSIL